MSLVVPSLLLLFLLVSMFAAAKVGERRRIQDERERPGEANDIATMEAAILGLMGLLLAFTFTESMERIAERRALVVREIESIESVYLRAALLEPQPADSLRTQLRAYATLRASLEREPFEDAQLQLIEDSRKLEREIWALVTAVLRENPDMAENMVDSVHEMFAADTERLAVLKHPAQVSVFALLGFLAIVSAGFSGYAVGAQPGKHWPHLLAFIVVTVMTIYLIVDMQYPRHGLVQVTDTIELYDTLLKALQ